MNKHGYKKHLKGMKLNLESSNKELAFQKNLPNNERNGLRIHQLEQKIKRLEKCIKNCHKKIINIRG